MLGLGLSAAAGFVDAVGWIAFSGVFVAFMSGNTTRLGVEAVRGNLGLVAPVALTILAFTAGAALGTVLRRLGGLPGLLAAEAALLAVSGAITASAGPAAILPLAVAMGMQNLARQPAGPAQLGGTFITGTLVGLGQAIATADWRAGGAQAAGWLALVAGIMAGAIAMGWVGAAPSLLGVALFLLLAAGTLALARG
jgi:oxalate decarboxylase